MSFVLSIQSTLSLHLFCPSPWPLLTSPVSLIFVTPLFPHIPIPAILSLSLLCNHSPLNQKRGEWDGMERELQVSIEVLSSQATHLRAFTSHKSAIACICLKVVPHQDIMHSCFGPLSPILILQSSSCLLSKIKRPGTDFQSHQSQKILCLLCICQERS